MKTIGIDCRFAATPSGLGRYTREITRYLVERDDPLRYLLFVRSRQEPWIGTLPANDRWSLEEAPYPHYSFREQFMFLRRLRRAPIALLFSPHFNVPIFSSVPKVTTIHDLILHHYPNKAPFLKHCAYRYLFTRSITSSRKIIAVSAFTARELTESFGQDVAGKITVIPEGVAGSFMPKSREEVQRVLENYGIKEPYFLYVGNAKEHKNVQTLIDAFTRLGSMQHSLVLVTSGKELHRLSIPTSARVYVLSDIFEGDLPALYTGALSFVTASLYEGFCLPVLEALACQCPVIATHTGAIPEWTRGAARLTAPNISALVSAMKSPPARPERMRLPSWEEAAKKTAGILQEAVQ